MEKPNKLNAKIYSDGFTLIELMIVVAVLGILTSLAFGFFGDNVIAANRTDGRSALHSTAGSLEKCRSLYGSYNAANCNISSPVSVVSDSGYYTITGSPSATSFTLTATPVAGLAQASDTDCTTLTLDNTGVQGGTGADAAECW